MKGYTVTVNKKTEPEMYQFLMNAENKQRTIKAGISLLMNQKKRQENTWQPCTNEVHCNRQQNKAPGVVISCKIFPERLTQDNRPMG